MQYESTRGGAAPAQSAEVIRRGLAPDGGLYVPTEGVCLRRDEMSAFVGMRYADVARAVLGRFLTDYSDTELSDCVEAAYSGDKFDVPEVAPLHGFDGVASVLELWHGPTSAFKDMALQALPRLVTGALRKTGDRNELVILVATSGDTGKAALEGFRDVPGTRIIVFYPEHGVSEMQKLQMITQEGGNVHAIGVAGGDFDDAQSGVKKIFADAAFNERIGKKGFELSSANSINWGRLVPQIAYYFSGYARLVERGEIEMGDRINIAVPTGNFGNILAAYYARTMGLPVGRLICASNSNNVLSDFFASGAYDKNRPLKKTMSPSMDIIVSSNLERLLFELSGHESEPVRRWMAALARDGVYRVGEEFRDRLSGLFWGGFCDEAETSATIKAAYEEQGYLVDTHTAVALNVYTKYRGATGDDAKTIVASTASPFKFNSSVVHALFGADRAAGKTEFELLEFLSRESGLPVPVGLGTLRGKEIRHRGLCPASGMEARVAEILGA
jgi:threonine synthase